MPITLRKAGCFALMGLFFCFAGNAENQPNEEEPYTGYGAAPQLDPNSAGVTTGADTGGAVGNPRSRVLPTVTSENREGAPLSRENRHSFVSLAGNLGGMYYIENIPPPTDSERGFLGGANVEFQTVINEKFAIRAIVDMNFGQTKYIGAFQDGTPVTATTNEFILDGEANAGYVFWLTPKSRLIAHLGFGTHFWNRGLTGVGAYPENYTFFYIPGGLRYENQVTEKVDIALDATPFINLGGPFHAYFSQTDITQRDGVGTIGASAGVKLSVAFSYLLNETISLKCEPFFEYFGIGVGNTFPIYSAAGAYQGTANEPSSNSVFYGAHLGLTFHF